MRHRLHFVSRQALMLWWGLLTVMLGATAPTVSLGLAGSAAPGLANLCTSLGASGMVLPDLSSVPEEDGPATHKAHCLLCLHGQTPLAPPPSACRTALTLSCEAATPTPGQVVWCATHVDGVPLPRGPPASLALSY